MADIIARLVLNSGSFDSKIKRATQGLLQMEQECRKVGGTLAILEKDQKQYVQSLGQMETVSKTARGKLGELKSAFVELSVQYKRLTDEEKKGDYGKALSASLDQLKARIKSAQADLSGVEREMKGFDNILGELGSKFGISSDLMGVVTTGSLSMAAGITAAAAAAGAAAKAFADYNSELSKQDQITSVTTGLKGGDAEKMTDAAASIAKVYGTDFREVINAANTLMTQFGQSGDSAIQLIRDGMQGMIQGDGPKLLSMIQQYAPSFRDAGISASQLVAIIQNSEGGIFTDQNMNAIVMGIKNIRLMTDATSQSLKQVGIDGEDMKRKLNDGSMTIFQALRQVAQAIDTTGSSSQAAGQVMQNVFGRQGAMAGTKLGEAIANLNTNLEETKTQTGGLGESLANLERAQESLNSAMRETFGMDGWEQMSNTIKAELLTALADTIKGAQEVGRAIAAISNDVEVVISPLTVLTKKIIDFGDFGVSAADAISVAFSGLLGPLGSVLNLLRSIGGSAGGAYDKALDAYEKQQQQAADRQQFTVPLPPGYKPPESGNGSGFTPKPTDGNRRTGRTGSKTTPPPTPDELASKEVEQAKERYRQEVVKATQNYANGMATEDEYQKKINDVLKQLYDAYNTIYAKYGRGTEAENMELLAGQILENNKPRMSDVSLDGIYTVPVKLGIDEKEMETFSNKIEKYFKDNPLPYSDDKRASNKLLRANKDGKYEAKANELLGSMAGGMQQVVGGLEQLGIDIPAEIEGVIGGMQAISSILTGIATTVLAIEAISGADALIPFAHGGIAKAAGGFVVPGNYMSGDKIPVAVNSGEIIMNRAQQGIIASQLEGGGMRGMVLDTQISAEAIRIVLNNNGRRTRRGEYVTTKKYGS